MLNISDLLRDLEEESLCDVKVSMPSNQIFKKKKHVRNAVIFFHPATLDCDISARQEQYSILWNSCG